MPNEPKNNPGVTIAGNNFTPADIEHLVTTAQEPPTAFQTEVQEELDRLEALKARRKA
jgi:hypothetical protein